MKSMNTSLSDAEYAALAEQEEKMYQEAIDRCLEEIDFNEYNYMSQKEQTEYCQLQLKIGRVDHCQCGQHKGDASKPPSEQ